MRNALLFGHTYTTLVATNITTRHPEPTRRAGRRGKRRWDGVHHVNTLPNYSYSHLSHYFHLIAGYYLHCAHVPAPPFPPASTHTPSTHHRHSSGPAVIHRHLRNQQGLLSSPAIYSLLLYKSQRLLNLGFGCTCNVEIDCEQWQQH
jgi:hypothetical protein